MNTDRLRYYDKNGKQCWAIVDEDGYMDENGNVITLRYDESTNCYYEQ
jgi:hypothetical protein